MEETKKEEERVSLKNLVSKQTETNTVVAVENREKFINIAFNKKESFFILIHQKYWEQRIS